MKKNTYSLLPVMETCYTIQGEGANTGMSAYFIRLGGCDVGCNWCDIKESWNAEDHTSMPVNKIVDGVVKHGAKNVVITGGEPLMYDLSELTGALRKKGLKIYLETSGVYALTGIWDWICLSPKKRKLPLADNYKKANELKVIVYNKDDFRFAEECAKQFSSNFELTSVQERRYLFLQPEWSRREDVFPLVAEYVKKHPEWKISLQTHKYVGIP